MRIRKLKNMPYAQAKVYEFRKNDGDAYNKDVLISYSTAVIVIDYTFNLVMCTGLYSRTTAKHISSFMREKVMSYYIAKRCVNDKMQYNFVTGEYSPLD